MAKRPTTRPRQPAKRQAQPAPQAPPAAAPSVVRFSDEGVPFHYLGDDTREIVSDAPGDRRFLLHVDGATFNHVSEVGDKWIYRKDQ